MRIFGGHDYYDVGLSMGIDPRVVLVRFKSKEVAAEDAGGMLLKNTVELRPEGNPWVTVRNVAVVFCSKVYRGVVVDMSGVVECFWSLEKLREWASARKKVVAIHGRWVLRKDGFTVEEYFAPFEASGELREFMIANKYSILVEREVPGTERTVFAVNPASLKKLGFAKAVDPYTAFQELSMWIGGVLGGTSPEIVKITDDKVLAQSHGFDKESFRGPRIK